MKQLFLFVISLTMASFFVSSCHWESKKTEAEIQQLIDDSLENIDPDTTLYGICGEGTSMHVLELLIDNQKPVNLLVDLDDNDDSPVKGGLLAGDHLAVIMSVDGTDTIARKIINLTTLEGKWTSLDRNFEIVQGGEVLSTLQSESNPYNSWKIHNGRLLLGRDTFDVLTLGADSLEIENDKGIFVYKRQ